MKKKAKQKERKLPPELDPVLPLPLDSRPPPIRQGDGASILKDETIKVVELPYGAYWMLWEYAERKAAEQYPRYINGPLNHVAKQWLEAVRAFRGAELGLVVPAMSEEKAKKARRILAEHKKATETKKKGSKPADEATAANPEPKKTRCKEIYDGDPGGRCKGPAGHSGKHRDKHGNRWSSE